MTRPQHRPVQLAVRSVLAALVIIAISIAAQPGVHGASSAVTVTLNVSSATNIDPSLCLTGDGARTSFGVVQASQSRVLPLPCSVTFGSTNDTSMIRAFQTDQKDTAMWGAPDGSPDTTFAGTGTLPFTAPVGTNYGTRLAYADGEQFATYSNTNGGVIQRWNHAGGADGTFGVSGGYTDHVTVTGHSDDDSNELIYDSAGRLVLVGWDNTGSDIDGMVCRFLPDGTFDTDFGTTGCITLDAAVAADDGLSSVIELPDGSYIVAGATGSFIGNGEAVAAHVGEDGVQDATFGVAGWWRSGVVTVKRAQPQVVRQASGRLLVAADSAGASHDIVVHGVTPAGGTDATWSGTGTVTLDPAGNSDWFRALGVDGSDRVYVSHVTNVAGSPYAHVTRLTSNGALDTTWGAAATGTVQIAAATVADQQSNHSTLGFNANLGGLLVDPAGSVTGAATTLGSQALVFRLTSTGRLDKTLASTGSLVIDVTAGDDRATDLERTADGRVLLGGYRTDLNTNWLHMIAPGPVIPDYSAATNNWAGTGAGLFGACLLGGANIATDVATWTPDSNLGADCADGDGDPWRPIVDTNDATALVARSSGAGETAARIDVMFGVRIDGGQKPGHYQAPITFEVLAPSA